jgi:hypothetical protein
MSPLRFVILAVVVVIATLGAVFGPHAIGALSKPAAPVISRPVAHVAAPSLAEQGPYLSAAQLLNALRVRGPKADALRAFAEAYIAGAFDATFYRSQCAPRPEDPADLLDLVQEELEQLESVAPHLMDMPAAWALVIPLTHAAACKENRA